MATIKAEGAYWCEPCYDFWMKTWEMFEQLDKVGKQIVAKVFLGTPEVGKDSPYHRRLKQELGDGE